MSDPKLKIFFDGCCYLCSKEIEIYRRRNAAGYLEFVDISHPDFDPATYGVDSVAVNREFHVQNSQGEIVKGVPAFIEIWQILPGWSVLAKVAANPLVNLIMRAGYVIFVKVRPYLPQRKATCSDGVCSR